MQRRRRGYVQERFVRVRLMTHQAASMASANTIGSGVSKTLGTKGNDVLARAQGAASRQNVRVTTAAATPKKNAT